MRISCCCFVFLLVLAPRPSAGLDLALVPDWGPPTQADTLQTRLRDARWLDDGPTFQAVRDSFWTLYPHHDAVLLETVLWLRDQQRLTPFLQAIADEKTEAFLELTGLSVQDIALLAGLASSYTGHLVSAADQLSRLGDDGPPRPAALRQLARTATALLRDEAYWESTLAAALASPMAAMGLLEEFATTSPFYAEYEFRDEAIARIRALPPRPQLKVTLAVAELCKHLYAPGVTADGLATWIDALHAESPAALNAYLDDILREALVWLDPADLQPLLEARAAWLAPRNAAYCRGLLLAAAGREHAAYAVLLKPADDFELPDSSILFYAVAWHPVAAEVEAWARRLAAESLYDWKVSSDIFRARGKTAAADSLRAIAARELPYQFAMQRLLELEARDLPAAAALVDSLRQFRFGSWIAGHRVFLAESSGDTATFDALRRAQSSFLNASQLDQAAAGARRRDDLARMSRLAEISRELAPAKPDLARQLAAATLQRRDLERARELIGDLVSLSGNPAAFADLRIDEAMKSGRTEEVREILVALLDDSDVNLAMLIEMPRYAEGAGWPDLADRAMAKLDAEAPGAPRVALARGELLAKRGRLDAARPILDDLAADWPGLESVKSALMKAGDFVDQYQDRTPERGVARLGGLTFEYDSTAWILERKATPGEFAGHSQLIIQDRHSYILNSRQDLVYRQRRVCQLLSEAAIEQNATLRIPFRTDSEMPRLICARTITPDGQVREVPLSDVRVTANRDDTADVSDVRDLVIPFAGLKLGTIIDFCIETSPSAVLDLGQAWTYRFGNESPQREEILEIVVAPGVEHRIYDAQAPVARQREDRDGSSVYRWTVPDVPAASTEEQAPFEAVFPKWVGCTTYRGWEELASVYGRPFWQRTTVDDGIRRRAVELTAGCGTEGEKLHALFSYVQKEVTNVGIELGMGRFVPTPASEVLARGYGDCKDKVATLVALLSAVNIDCQPVLVGARPIPAVVSEFPSAASFNHVIAYVPGVGGGMFCDPTLGVGCEADLPVEVCGQQGLLIDHDNRGRLVSLPEHAADDSEIEISVDLRPLAGRGLEADVTAIVREATARYWSPSLASSDTNTVNQAVRSIAGNRLDEELSPIRWSQRPLPCGAFELKATLRDTSWTTQDSHDAHAYWFGASDDGLTIPESKDRTLPVTIGAPQSYSLVLRVHEAPGWRVSPRHIPINVDAPGFHGEVTVEQREKDEDRWLEIRRLSRFTKREYSLDEFKAVRDQYLSFRLASFQPVHYQRLSDETRLAQIRKFCEENPEDFAFSTRAAMEVLGGDYGGDGQAGRDRRQLARNLLAPALANPDVGGIPFLMASYIATKDNRFRDADSLLAIGLSRTPNDPYLLGTAIWIKNELWEYADAVDVAKRAQAVPGGEGASFSLIELYVTLGDDDSARQQQQRLELMVKEVDKAALAQAWITGFIRSMRLDDASRTLEDYRGHLPEIAHDLFRVEIAAAERQWSEAIGILEPLQNERPLDRTLNNNLAWYLVCAGRDLERAEYHARMAQAIRGDDGSSDNTLAVVLMRQGREKEARAIFQELMADDRPGSRLANGYFLGLSYWLTGDRQQALDLWRELAALGDRDDMGRAVKEALRLADAGEDPAWVYLWPLEIKP